MMHVTETLSTVYNIVILIFGTISFIFYYIFHAHWHTGNSFIDVGF